MSNHTSYKVELLGFLVSIVFCALAMIFYAGGTQMDPSAPGYSFWFNTISDSGRLFAHNGEPNFISFIFLCIAWIVLGITWIPFYIVFPRVFEEGTRERKLSKKGGYLGIIASIAHILVVLAPVDVLFLAHYLIAFILYICLLSAMILFSLTIKTDERFSKKYRYTFILFTAIFGLYVILAFTSIGIGIRELMTIFQKIGRFSIYAGFTVLTIGAWKLDKNK
jgi:hypothetical protein